MSLISKFIICYQLKVKFYFTYLYTVPPPNTVNMAIISTQMVSQSLALQCNATTVRGITSRVDIVWSSNGVELRRTEGVNSSFIFDSSVTYTDYYNALQLNTTDDGSVYQCEVFINTSPTLMADSNITLDITG